MNSQVHFENKLPMQRRKKALIGFTILALISVATITIFFLLPEPLKDEDDSSDTDGDGSAYTWPTYDPTISYNFKDEYGDVSEPTEVLDDCSGVVGTQSSGWWTFR